MRKISLIAAAAAMTAGSLSADIQIGKGLTVGGYIDMVYQNADAETQAAAGGAVESADSAGFNVATAEIDFMMDFGNGLTAQVDLEGNVLSDETLPAATGKSEVAVEQARIDYAFGQSTLTLGKFDTFIGLEGLEAPDLYQFSNSLTFAYEPTQHEGIAYAYNGGMWNVAAAVVNSFGSNNSNTAGDGKELSYAVHAGIAPTDSLSFNFNYAIENVSPTLTAVAQNADQNVWTLDASYSNHGWTVGAEYVSIDTDSKTTTTTTEMETKAWMLMANYMFTERFGLTGRYSKSEENSGAVGAADVEGKEFTVAASYAFTPNWSGLIEYRSEEFDRGHSLTGAVGTGVAGSSLDADVITVETILTF
jgi:hypothetical protein